MRPKHIGARPRIQDSYRSKNDRWETSEGDAGRDGCGRNEWWGTRISPEKVKRL